MTIKELRDKMGLSQSKFADYIGIPVRTLQTWEQGSRTPPEYVMGLIERVMRLEGKLK